MYSIKQFKLDVSESKNEIKACKDEDLKFEKWLLKFNIEKLNFAKYLMKKFKDENYVIDLCGHEYPWAGFDATNFETFVCYATRSSVKSKTEEFFADDTRNYHRLCSMEYDCYKCSKRYLTIVIDKKNKKVLLSENDPTNKGTELITNDCIYKDGFKPYSVEINIPSGIMILTNCLRDYYDWRELPKNKDLKHTHEFSVNCLHGRKLCSEKQAELNCIELNVGNGTCDMFEINKEKFIVGSDCYIDDNGEDGVDFTDYKKVGEVCTDFWGYCVVDKDDLLTKMSKEELNGIGFDEVKCKPGRYRFIHRYNESHEDKKGEIYTNIECIGEI